MNTTQSRRNWQPAWFLVICFAVFVTACKKPVDPPAPQAQLPTIASISPVTAPIGSTIAISGTNFSSPPSSNTVTINGVPATVVSGTSTSLVVQVPAGTGAGGPVVVTSAGGTAQSTTSLAIALKPVVEVQGGVQNAIRQNVTWTKDKVYLLKGAVYVATNYTLTIEAGTVIRGAGPEQDPEGKGRAGTLIIERIAKLNAIGTAAEPIVFTSAKPAGQRNYGDWGGIIFVGKAPTNRPGATPLVGTRSTAEAYYEPGDNSGTLQYVRIEFAGATPTPAATNGIGALTMYGVGSGTSMNHVQVSYSGSDSFAWFGGEVNMKHVVSFRCADDDWSSDWGYTNKRYTNIVQAGPGGKVQFGVALRDPSVADPSGANSFESQNFDGTGEIATTTPCTQNCPPQTAPIFANISSFAFNTTPNANPTARGGAYRAAMHLRANTAISIYNSVFVGYPEGLRLDGTATGTLANATNNELDLRGIVLANTLTPVVGGGAITDEQATAYFTATGRSNQIISSSELTTLLLNPTTFTLTNPNFVPLPSSPLLTGGVTTGKVADSFFERTTYRGAFGTENWLQGWTNFNPQTVDYDR